MRCVMRTNSDWFTHNNYRGSTFVTTSKVRAMESETMLQPSHLPSEFISPIRTASKDKPCLQRAPGDSSSLMTVPFAKPGIGKRKQGLANDSG